MGKHYTDKHCQCQSHSNTHCLYKSACNLHFPTSQSACCLWGLDKPGSRDQRANPALCFKIQGVRTFSRQRTSTHWTAHGSARPHPLSWDLNFFASVSNLKSERVTQSAGKDPQLPKASLLTMLYRLLWIDFLCAFSPMKSYRYYHLENKLKQDQ